MNVNCQWIETNLESLFCDTLTEEESRLARAHIEDCTSCRKEAQALNAVDPVIKNYFRHELEVARRPRFVHKGRVFGFSTAAGALVIVLSLLVLRTPQPAPLTAPVALAPTVPPVPQPNTPAPIKQNDPGEVQRAKPSAEPSAPADRPTR